LFIAARFSFNRQSQLTNVVRNLYLCGFTHVSDVGQGQLEFSEIWEDYYNMVKSRGLSWIKIYWQSKCSTVIVVNLATLGLLR
jgi:hypothetical protein